MSDTNHLWEVQCWGSGQVCQGIRDKLTALGYTVESNVEEEIFFNSDSGVVGKKERRLVYQQLSVDSFFQMAQDGKFTPTQQLLKKIPIGGKFRLPAWYGPESCHDVYTRSNRHASDGLRITCFLPNGRARDFDTGQKVTPVISKEADVLSWAPDIKTAPQGQWVLLIADSGYTSTPWRIEVGRFSAAKERYEDLHGAAWEDAGSLPVAWLPLPWIVKSLKR